MLKTVNGRWGPCTYFAKDEYVGKSIHYYGEYNPDETEKILSLAAEGGGTCMDIGANIGVISQALLQEGFWVKAFEPQPQVFDLLVMNMRGRGCAVNTAVGASIGSVDMPKVHYSEKGNFGGLSCGTRSHLGSYRVPVTVIDAEFYKSRIGFIKIDVEGFELQVLKGAERTIAAHRPIMYIEDDRAEKSKALRKYITDLGYTIEEHQPTLYRKENFFGLKKNVWDKNYASHNLICRPC